LLYSPNQLDTLAETGENIKYITITTIQVNEPWGHLPTFGRADFQLDGLRPPEADPGLSQASLLPEPGFNRSAQSFFQFQSFSQAHIQSPGDGLFGAG
jgi:hypothetical protein